MNLISDLWQQFHYKDLVDILIVSFLIYQLLHIIRGTRAVQMLIGVSALGAMFWFGHHFELYSLNWLLSHIFDSLLIIFVIIFQEQIRTAFANIGSGSHFFGVNSKEDFQDQINEIVEVIGHLKKKKIGALIVIERRNGLENYANSGSSINGEIHSDLLFSIFQSSSPLHDGAVIISRNRIRAAGCFLPLSKELDLDRSFGTRHRAALGISESSDAIAITVSEETGKIHLSVGGVFTLCKDHIELGSQLRNLMENGNIEKLKKPEVRV